MRGGERLPDSFYRPEDRLWTWKNAERDRANIPYVPVCIAHWEGEISRRGRKMKTFSNKKLWEWPSGASTVAPPTGAAALKTREGCVMAKPYSNGVTEAIQSGVSAPIDGRESPSRDGRAHNGSGDGEGGLAESACTDFRPVNGIALAHYNSTAKDDRPGPVSTPPLTSVQRRRPSPQPSSPTLPLVALQFQRRLFVPRERTAGLRAVIPSCT
ncbi:uncharacterized protein BDR25DRAFT_315108 [Lindgomyces ingoldianus]|uniref:Uncharacterized protein n=1 Tax=Lindgomyces ingoldianus TaxID=673940 RepID=A0ACB6QSC1_9PLEO|nr:uncharacterized protein BDR25DRAFT_315108 [Lindgomyces ingoldianus]KAF2469888.1 hypothetical protein BDR25DRAFT_315108 [Lindgomyces ingoldianus]